MRSLVARAWPAGAAGEALAIGLSVDGSLLRVQVVHLGAPLGADGVESLNRSLGTALERETAVIDIAIPPEALTRADGDLRFLSRVTAGVKASATARDAVGICVTQPEEPAKRDRPAKPNHPAKLNRTEQAD